MALNKQKVSIPFARGVDTKNDDKQEPLGSLNDLQNVVFETPLTLKKRPGFDDIKLKTIDQENIEGAQFLTSFKDELNIFTLENLYSYSSSLEKWTSKGRVFSIYPTSRTVLRNDRSQKNLDSIEIEGLLAYTYEDSTGVRVTISDSENNHTILGNSLISASGTAPRLSRIQNTLFIFFKEGTDIKYRKINTIAPTTIDPEAIAVTDLDATNPKYDVVAMADTITIAYNSSDSGGTLRLRKVNSDETLSSTISISGETASHALSVETDSSSRCLVTFSDGSDVKFLALSFRLDFVIVATSSIETIADVVNTTVVETTTGVYQLFYEVSATDSTNHLVKQNTIDLAATVGAPSVIKRSVGLASKAFYYGTEPHVLTIHDSPLQSTYFLINNTGSTVTKVSPGTGGTLVSENALPTTVALSDSKFVIPTQTKGQIVVEEESFFSLLGVVQTTFNFEPADPYQNVSLGNNLHITGGILKMYDGKQAVEHGFQLFPENVVEDSSTTTGGSISDGTRQFSAVYAWTDNQGNLHRSAPSIPITVISTGGTATQKITLSVPTLRITEKEDAIIEVYGTEAAGTVFYKHTQTTAPVYNDPTVDSILVEITDSDTDLIDNEILYITGGVLDNIAAPAATLIESFQSRLFLAGLEQENTIAYSKILFDGQPVSFNDTLTIKVNNTGGPITALRKMDDKLIIFKDDACFFLSGEGPNNLGEQDTFIIPQLVSSEIGCIDPNSVVLTPAGLMFKSKKGVYLLTRGLGLDYIGSNVEAYNDEEITSAVVVADDNQVRFTTRNGPCLVYNYFTQQWATFTNYRAVSAILLNSEYHFLDKNQNLLKETPDSYTDNGSPVNMAVETSWINFAGVQGFQRVYRLLLLGEFKSPHKLRIRVAYDFNESYVQEKIVDTADFLEYNLYGTDSPYGTGTPYGGDGNVHQLRVDLKRQKCQSIKIKIEEIQESTLGEGLSLSNIAFEVGAKSGLNKIATDKQYGTE